ncbi:hypothetical protein D1007_43755 [Hordeum vulgare]|nr:hypothetical protein D1007_43755 [Hordeum vulgare]
MEVMEAKERLPKETKGKAKEKDQAWDEVQSVLNKEEVEEVDFLQPYLHLLSPSLIELLSCLLVYTGSTSEEVVLIEISRVCEKVEAKGRTTYNESAYEAQRFDEKNIRRRVYDAFNVLIALRVIAKEKKEIRWMGLSNYRYEKLKKLEEVRKELVNKIRHKKALLQEIEKQFDDLQNIKLRNETLQSSAENVNGIRLPFVLVKTSRKARVEIEISEDSKFAHFEFNGAPFTLHDDLSILEGIRRNSIGRAGRATLH